MNIRMNKKMEDNVISYAAMKRAALRNVEFRKEYEAIQPGVESVIASCTRTCTISA